MTKKFKPQFVDPKGILATDLTLRGLIAVGATKPTDGTAGFTPGCLFIDNDATTSGLFLYINEGTGTSCSFKPFTMTSTEMALLTGLLATATEINRNNKASTRLVASGANLTVTQALHDGKTINLAAAAAVVLPVMSGSGSRYRFVCPQDSTAVTITATAAHLFGGVTVGTDSAFAAGTLFTVGFAANGAGSTIITFDGSTRGGKKGDWVEIEDVATSVGIVRGMLNGSGTEATPFS